MHHLLLEIYAPYVDRPTDMVHIWRRCRILCNDLREAPRLQHLTVMFLDSDTNKASWSIDGWPCDTMNLVPNDDQDSDIVCTLDLFATLNNVTRATIKLPHSLQSDVYLQDECGYAIDCMMDMVPVDQENHDEIVKCTEEEIEEEVPRLMELTGIKSLQKFTQTIQSGSLKTISSEFPKLKNVWPYTEIFEDALERERKGEMARFRTHQAYAIRDQIVFVQSMLRVAGWAPP
ncbi:hypothetical protein ACLMJK_001125 [Lecanora helva]